MSKRDTIIVAVLINIGLLAVLFMVATNSSEEKEPLSVEKEYAFEQASPIIITPSPEMPFVQESNISSLTTTSLAPRDEVDEALNSYAKASQNSLGKAAISSLPTVTAPPIATSPSSIAMPEEAALFVVEKQQSSPVATDTAGYIEVIVKKGDALEKIARAHGTTVEAIKKANHLTNERLSIGQVLKVTSDKAPKEPEAFLAKATTPAAAASEAVYYVIKSGDNPWKIARQFKVKYEDILRFNNLNEEKARNLKVGDKIRVK